MGAGSFNASVSSARVHRCEYDFIADPHNVHNLADDPQHAETLKRMRAAQLEWVQETKDIGLIPEPIIAERVKAFGSEYSVLRTRDDPIGYNRKLGAIAAAASDGPNELPELLTAATDDDSAIRTMTVRYGR